MVEAVLEQIPNHGNDSKTVKATFVSMLEKLNEEMNERANNESCDGFSISPGFMDGTPGFYVKMTREFLLGRIEGAEYDWQTYALIINKAWAEPNLAIIGKRFLELGIIEEIPEFWNWDSMREYLPKKRTEVCAFFPDERAMEG
jgi:hypothetical protein